MWKALGFAKYNFFIKNSCLYELIRVLGRVIPTCKQKNAAWERVNDSDKGSPGLQPLLEDCSAWGQYMKNTKGMGILTLLTKILTFDFFIKAEVSSEKIHTVLLWPSLLREDGLCTTAAIFMREVISHKREVIMKHGESGRRLLSCQVIFKLGSWSSL